MKDPFVWFASWWQEALLLPARFPNAVVLATAGKRGPASRMVLLKEFSPRGFIFFTNYQSGKARELAENPKASLTFYWDSLGRQVRIWGKVKKTSRKESEAYFSTRPRGSQLGAWASEQSSELESREKLMKRIEQFAKKYPREVPCPPHWGGFILDPTCFEFWTLQEDRLHDRIRFEKAKTGWRQKRLAP